MTAFLRLCLTVAVLYIKEKICAQLCAPRSGSLCDYGDGLFLGDNLDKQLVRYQRRRKGQVIQPFQGDVTEYIHSQEAASMSPPSDRG